ncbi:uncharacterized protein CCOS01_04402 [Colletotrichum costaricense]|uniref:Protein kinase domain-containing protein n=1 Tax=Colletotrichum costaricense TaxID=1209916 RepID=A0AAI9Z3R5_9PEZI|nr:uncharacterized protein CCOS01_04402 [Colletotrichum costaricense]KAK1532419.1 hypothetical protein CCOS01_04402 [Colletotrichum costaricense]
MTSNIGEFLIEFSELFGEKTRRVPELYGNGDPPPRVVSRPSDISVTSSRIDNHHYGMDLPNQSPPEDDEVQIGPATCMIDEIHRGMQSTKNGSSGPWLSFDKLRTFSQRSRVNSELRKQFSDIEAARLTNYVCGVQAQHCKGGDTSQRIFVILVLIRRLEILPALVTDGLRDKDLPFEWADPASRDHLISARSDFADGHLPCFEKAGIAVSREFYLNQWMILTPLISLDEYNEVTTFHLASEVIMPWTSIGIEKTSGFSRVRRVEIHDSHHPFREHKAFALKTLLQEDPEQAEQEFEQELKALTKMEPGEHILKLCATFKIGTEYSFLSPWAEGGNLRQFWTESPREIQQSFCQPQILLRWMAEQCHALAAALQSIHDVRVKALIRAKRISKDEETDSDVFGIHGDIKPENILLFDYRQRRSGIGTLKIADFGLTEFHKLTSRSRTYKPSPEGRRLAPTYEAPELSQLGGSYSRKADVWALGCVFSEFLTWVVRGPSATTKFADDRAKERDWDTALKKDVGFYSDNFFTAKRYKGGGVKTSLKRSVVKRPMSR